jgi:MerR family transcriptional regulator, thiopeptide resistance regulator
MSTGGYSVGDVARSAHITVRTLHHYDEIGLLRPSGRTASGYRSYSDADLDRLQRILAYRQLGFPLDKIAAILDDPDVDPIDHLRRQRDAVADRIEELQRMVAALEKTMEARKMGINLTPEEQFEVFGDQPLGKWADEAEQRWGDADAFRESQRRAASYTKRDWERVKAESEEINVRFAELMRSGQPADSVPAMDVAEAHRAHIDRWFYPLPYAMHCNLAGMYLQDPRFTATYEKQAAGLAQYVHDAIITNADRH